MTLKERLGKAEKRYSEIIQELGEMKKKKIELETEGVEIQGKIQLLNEMIAEETKSKE